LVGRFVRPFNPTPEKLEIYECGEPAIGSSFVQFDLRFYVVALLFIIFDVEVAFFFPWAAVFGKSTNVMHEKVQVVQNIDGEMTLTPAIKGTYQEMGIQNPQFPLAAPPSLANEVTAQGTEERATEIVHAGFEQLAWVTVVDIAAFFAILMIGFAYVWKRGDLDWVRAVGKERGKERGKRMIYDPLEDEQFLSV